MTNDKWNNEELEFLKNNYKNMTIAEIATSLNRSTNAIKCKANKLGLKQDKRYYYNKSFFKNIDSEEKAYWLGFIYADGYVTKTKRHYCVGIELNKNDESHLKKFNKSINGNLQVYFRKRKNCYINGRKIKDSECCQIRVFCEEMLNDLVSHGCCQNKSLTKTKPVGVPDYLMNSFIRGYFDGNGTVCYSYNKKVNKSYRKIAIESGSEEYISWLSFFMSNLGISNRYAQDHTNAYKLEIRPKSHKQFIDYIYSNSNIHLDRKYNIAVYGESVISTP